MASIKYKTEDGYVSIPMSILAKTNEENGNGIGTCSTSSGTALTVSLTGYELVQNGFVAVTFENDVPANATLNINSKGAKPIIYKGSAIEADTIKADDTVMFAYDGTNYVVVSLGGGGSVQSAELVIINLSTEDNDNSDLIGASVKIYDTELTTRILLETTWDGNDIQFIINTDTPYTVEVKSFTDRHDIENNTQAYIAELVQRHINFVYENSTEVDLGLPSGLIWKKRNIGANSKIGFGNYFSWGNIIPHDGSGVMGWDSYSNTPGESLTGNIPVNATYDAARAILGSPWRMPTKDEFQELIDYTDHEQVTIKGINCLKFMKKTDHSIYMVMPFCGRGGKTGPDDVNEGFDLWTSTYENNILAFDLYSYAKYSGMYELTIVYRFSEHNIRAVK